MIFLTIIITVSPVHLSDWRFCAAHDADYKKAKYVEVMERALYNTVLAGIAMDGKSFSMSIRWKYGYRAVWSEPPKSM